MKKTKFIILFLPFLFLSACPKNIITCQELMNRVVTQAVFLEEVTPWPENSFVVSVKQYVHGTDHYAIAELVQDKEGRTKKYVFCGISTDDWSDFTWSVVDQELTFGQKFRKYILPYKCNCQ